jgi:hypothetical protein
MMNRQNNAFIIFYFSPRIQILNDSKVFDLFDPIDRINPKRNNADYIVLKIKNTKKVLFQKSFFTLFDTIDSSILNITKPFKLQLFSTSMTLLYLTLVEVI